jgi:hypothetical protein
VTGWQWWRLKIQNQKKSQSARSVASFNSNNRNRREQEATMMFGCCTSLSLSLSAVHGLLLPYSIFLSNRFLAYIHTYIHTFISWRFLLYLAGDKEEGEGRKRCQQQPRLAPPTIPGYWTTTLLTLCSVFYLNQTAAASGDTRTGCMRGGGWQCWFLYLKKKAGNKKKETGRDET